MNIFVYISGLASVLGLVLQLKDAFPQNRRLREKILLIVLGIFIGSLLGGLKVVQLSLFTGNSELFTLPLIISISACIVISLIMIGMMFTKDTKKMDFLGASLYFILVFFGIILFFSFMLGERNQSENNINLNLDELKLLVDIHETNKNYNRSIEIVEIMKSKISNKDIRLESLNTKLESLKKKQLE